MTSSGNRVGKPRKGKEKWNTRQMEVKTYIIYDEGERERQRSGGGDRVDEWPIDMFFLQEKVIQRDLQERLIVEW